MIIVMLLFLKYVINLGFAPNLLGIRHDLTLWIDPYEVTIRYVSHHD